MTAGLITHPTKTEHTWVIVWYELSRDRKTVEITEKCKGCPQARKRSRPLHEGHGSRTMQ